MGVHSGKFAAINGKRTMRLWTIDERVAQPRGAASNSLQGTFRARGVHSWSGSYQAYGATPDVMPGDEFAFVGFGAPGNDVDGGTGSRYEGNAVVSQVSLNWNWRAGALIGHSVNFTGDLDLAVSNSGAAVTDSSPPQVMETTGTKITFAYGDLGVYQELPACVSAALRLTLPVPTFVNSSTYVGGKSWTGAKSGAPLDWNLSIQQEDDERIDTTKIWQKDDVLKLRLYVNATAYWELKYGIAGDFTGVSWNRETGAIMARTLNVNMNGYYYGGAGTGHITMPDGTTWWPF